MELCGNVLYYTLYLFKSVVKSIILMYMCVDLIGVLYIVDVYAIKQNMRHNNS